ncbi:heterokaryon incompatibility protein-domain-containing protein [Nemania sp. FL0031]|nr:heterokaryon incompatibility protein-domain-containing protein [Nemania sp. FL0031]
MQRTIQSLTSHYMSLSGWGAGSHNFATSDNESHYRQLSTHRNEIRLLILEPAATPSDHLRCRLEYVSLDQANHDFVALSYTWGNTSHSSNFTQVTLNDKLWGVTVNLYRALVELRSRGYLKVWADSLCINQEDLEERSQMVLRMGVIYRSAKMVVSFLDASDPSDPARSVLVSHLILRVLQELKTWNPTAQDKKRIKTYISGDLESKMAAFTDEMCAKAVANLRIDEAQRLALLRFLHHEYWLRAWIIQELSMNIRLQIIWAQNVFDLSELAIVLRALSRLEGVGPSKARRHIQHLADIRKSQLQLKSLSLVEVLHRCNQAQASQRRDRVYALLGLTHDGAKLVPFPSYEMKMADISRDITQRMIQATGKIDLVVLHHRSQDNNAWYPNWFIQETWINRSPLKGPSARPNWAQPNPRGPIYRASGDERAQVEFRGENANIKGFPLGRVSSCSPTLEEARASRLPETQITKSRTWKPSTTAEPGRSFASAGRVTKSLRWLLVEFDTSSPRDSSHASGKQSSSTSEPRRSFGLLHKLLSRREKEVLKHAPHLIQWLNYCEAQSFEINGQPFVGYFSQKNDKNSSPPSKFQGICETLQSNLETGMRVGSLGDTEFLGWLPKETRKGDEVFVLLGSSMPCVLRKAESKSPFWSIVGPCYVDGAMNGELVKKGLRELQDVVLY